MKNIYIFDIDGVITDLTTKEIDLNLVKKLEELIKGGSIVVFNSGRAVSWIEEKVIAELNISKDLLSSVFLVGEFGAVSVSYIDGGERQENQDPEVSIRGDLKEEVIRLVEGKYRDSNFFDTAKKGMITVEKMDGYSLKDYLNLIPSIKADFEEILARKGLTNLFEVTNDPIAVNIRAEKLDKIYSTKVALNWMKEKNYEIGNFLVFGDQPADLEMANEIAIQGYPVKMIYVGENPIEGGKDYLIIKTKEKYTRGTLAFLEETQL
jgi:hydroxymethylpyrimidine pyrophosphatase-like HAD family hydrolase